MRRILPAPSSRVFRTLTEPDEFAKWWGPNGYTASTVEIDLRVGGAYRIAMQPPEDELFYLVGEFLEVDPPTRLSYTFRWEDADPEDRKGSSPFPGKISVTPPSWSSRKLSSQPSAGRRCTTRVGRTASTDSKCSCPRAWSTKKKNTFVARPELKRRLAAARDMNDELTAKRLALDLSSRGEGRIQRIRQPCLTTMGTDAAAADNAETSASTTQAIPADSGTRGVIATIMPQLPGVSEGPHA